MKENYRKALLENYLELFVEKKKESDMLIASGRGLLNRVAEMMNGSVRSFMYKGLKVSSGCGDVIYRLITSEAKLDSFYENEIQVVLGLACSPTEIKGRVRLTKKEAEIVPELQKIWDKNMKHCYFFDTHEFKTLAGQLSELSHHLTCYRELNYYYGMDDFYLKRNLLKNVYDLSNLTDDPYDKVSTLDLVPLIELFEKTVRND